MSHERHGAVFWTVSAGVALVNLDLFVVNVGLPDIGTAMAADLAALSWVVSAYAIAFAALLVPSGRIADRAGRRGAYLVGLTVFAGASIVCGASDSIAVLIGARIVQAAGGALLVPASLGLLLAVTPAERRAGAVRGWTAVAGASAAVGPALGGVLVGASWRWVFWINVPIALAALALGSRVLPRAARQRTDPPLDLVAVALGSGALALVSLALVQGNAWGWASPRVASAAAAAAMLGIWFARRTRDARAPLVDRAILRDRHFQTATAAAFVFTVGFSAMLLSRVLWLQAVWGWDAVRTGLAIAPGPLAVPVVTLLSAPLVRRHGPVPVILTGAASFAAGGLLWAVSLEPTANYVADFLPGLLLTGVGVALVLPATVGAALGSVPPHHFATGTAVVTVARQIGTVLGVALLVSIVGTTSSSASVLAADDRADALIAATALASALLAARLSSKPAAAPAAPVA